MNRLEERAGPGDPTAERANIERADRMARVNDLTEVRNYATPDNGADGAGFYAATPEAVPAPPTYIGRADPFAKATRIWGTANIKSMEDVITIGPIGSRNDVLLVWRSATPMRVATGGGDTHACFEGTLQEFEKAVETTYGEGAAAYLAPETIRRARDDYRAAIGFLLYLEGKKAGN